jgi:hypothetical protein
MPGGAALTGPTSFMPLLIEQVVVNQVFQQFLVAALMLRRQLMLFSVLRDVRKR